MSKGFNCECGKYHAFSMWVFAHGHVELIHTCDACGRKHLVFNFEVELYEEPQPAPKKKRNAINKK